MTTSHTALSFRTRWERSVMSQHGGTTALLVSISAQQPTQSATRPAMDVAFVIDRSGSMGGGKLEQVKRAVSVAVRLLTPEDRFSVVAFDNEIEVVMPLSSATVPATMLMQSHLRQLEPRGGTNLSDGWLNGCQQLATVMPGTPDGRVRRVILLTDGQANGGITDPGQLARHATVLRESGISTTTMGFGHGFDEILLGSLAEAGGGNFEFMKPDSDMNAFFLREIGGLSHVVALNPHLTITLPVGLQAELLNQFPSHQHGTALTIDVKSMSAGEQVVLVTVVRATAVLPPHDVRIDLATTWTSPGDGERCHQAIPVPPLTVGSEAEAASAPLDPSTHIARQREEAHTLQRDALRLDREGQYAASRATFAASRQRLENAAQYVTDDDTAEEFQAEMRTMDALVQAPAAMLSEDIHKERAAYRQRMSRGGTRRE